ncbi:nucleoside/nucleotide kinase family protein [Actinokineospora bangkokensis]|uniref:Uridine kinase n=1 Tax=Actinokineospora bangkokensis TaxID=1193682 RepID=A0A1Q9LQB1_9PSEU|nr:uridine kinase [Actinokineospora bangkokensis]OLR94212.1 uridine kinase [Actinokineospora bangkokensis]
MRFRPVSPDALVERLVDAVAARGRGGWTRLLVDGAPPAGTGDLAAALVEPLRVLGHPVLRVRAADFLRPASLRFEHGKQDPDARLDLWLDEGALRREVLDPLDPGGTGRVLPSLWDAAADRATRADYAVLPPGGVLVLDGELLLGRGLPHELSVHLWLSPAALARRLAAEEHWALPAFARYEDEVDPLRAAGTGVRADDPRHPALLVA